MRIRAPLGFLPSSCRHCLASLGRRRKKAEGHKFPGLETSLNSAGEWEVVK